MGTQTKQLLSASDSSDHRSHRPPTPRRDRPDDRPNNHADRHVRPRHPRPHEPAGAASRPETNHRHARRSSSSSPAAAPPATRANERTRQRGSTRTNREPIRCSSSSKPRCHRSGSTLWHAATARSAAVHTTRDHQPWLPHVRDRHTARSRTTAAVLGHGSFKLTRTSGESGRGRRRVKIWTIGASGSRQKRTLR
jgi:hypothetical protein